MFCLFNLSSLTCDDGAMPELGPSGKDLILEVNDFDLRVLESTTVSFIDITLVESNSLLSSSF